MILSIRIRSVRALILDHYYNSMLSNQDIFLYCDVIITAAIHRSITAMFQWCAMICSSVSRVCWDASKNNMEPGA